MASRLQRVARQGAAAGRAVATDSTSTWSEGGKAPRSPRPRRILKPREPLREISGAPETHGVAITVQFDGNAEIGRPVGGRSP